MSAKNQKIKNKKLPVIIAAAGLLLAIGAAGFLLRDGFTAFPGPLQVDLEGSGKPRFVFDTAKLPDWASFGSVWLDASEIEGGSESHAAFSATQCVEGSNCSSLVEQCRVQIDESNQSCQKLEEYKADGCMVLAYYFESLVNPDTVVADELQEWGSFGTDPQEVGVKTLTMNTPEGDKEYQFYQYDTNNSSEYKRGSAFGFVPLRDGHIEV